MRRYLQLVAVAALLFALAPVTAGAQAAAGLDQYQLQSDILYAIHAANPIGQWLTGGADGLLSGVEFSLGVGGSPSDVLVVEVFDFTGGTLGALRGSTSISPSDLGSAQTVLDVNAITATVIPLEDLDIVISSGETIAIWLTTAATLPDHFSVYSHTTDGYPNGELITTGGTVSGYDLMFKTFVARPVFADGFESGDTFDWSATVGGP